MAKTTVVQNLLAIELRQGWILLAAFGLKLLPIDMAFERPVTGLTTDCHFSHRRVVCVTGCIVAFPNAGVVATSAHTVPVHAASGPVAPLTRFAIFIPVDIEPLVAVRIVRGFQRLKASAWE